MKALSCFTAVWLLFLVLVVSSVQSETQVLEGYTFIRGATKTSVCLGRWIPPRDVGLTGVCDGQVADVDQLSALSAKLSADRLDQLLGVLSSIDQKMAVSNEQIRKLVQATSDTRDSIDQQVTQVSDLLYETITQRFDELPEEIMTNDRFREEITKLREDILKEVEKHYVKKPAPPAK